jgi:predicted RNA-binding Zn-ribbon protein involved in translation (DUF1610 family)
MIKEKIECQHCEYINIILENNEDVEPFYCERCGKRLITFAEHVTMEQARYAMKLKKAMYMSEEIGGTKNE